MTTNRYTLVIGDKNLSSWSLRPWLALKHCGIPFAEEHVRLRQADSKAEILRHTPSGKVPALKTRTGVVWDSLAILEYLAERHPSIGSGRKPMRRARRHAASRPRCMRASPRSATTCRWIC
jgi:glutathione S-transferase